ncbi:CPBP family intramembrane glutamic endopeptidase [Virgibacillus sp. W0430]|uniref:CPBP family intramembrane glutamic endopeptidase n=1 Tax=Virgibacillus sp. W0430 TaxID=3391580 RepID=UPI003F4808D0
MLKNKNGQFRSGWIILVAFIIMFLVQGVFTIPGSLFLSFIELSEESGSIAIDMGEAFSNYPWLLLIAQGGGTVGGIIATVLIWRLINKQQPSTLGLSGSVKDFVYGLLLGAISITIIFIVLYVTGNIQLLTAFSNPQISSFTFSFLILFILVGFFEEMFFRGYVMNTMILRGNKKWIIYVASALFFSIVHGANPNVSLFGLVNLVLVGLLFAYMYDATKSLLLPIGYHITWNYFQGNIFGFAVSGTTPHGLYEIDISQGNALLTGGSFGLEGGVLATALILLGFAATKLYVHKRNYSSLL